ncbi:MAG: hypothetical protein RLZZ244_1448 [Verrucomicrobiota bacterium]
MIRSWLQRLLAPSAPPPGSGAFSPRSVPESSTPSPWMDVPTLMAIRSLELRVHHLVEGLSRGIHRSVRRGYSTEFTEYRPYTPGDDLRHMDWRRLARTDRPFVRQYEDESEWGCLFVLDLSASMAFGSLSHSKADYARTLTGTLASFLHAQGDPVGLLRFAKDSGECVPLRHAPRHLARFWSVLAAPPAGDGTSLGQALLDATRLLRRPGLVVLLSDFLCAPSLWAEPLRLLKAARHHVLGFQVLDPQEILFSFEGDTRFENLETPLALELDATRARDAYLANFEKHRREVASLCAAEGVPLLEARTNCPLEPLLRSALHEIARQRPLSAQARADAPESTSSPR